MLTDGVYYGSNIKSIDFKKTLYDYKYALELSVIAHNYLGFIASESLYEISTRIKNTDTVPTGDIPIFIDKEV